MKKLLLPLLLILAIGLLSAVESDPSEVVGYVKYEMVAGNNLVAIPMECPWTWAGEDLGASFAGDVDQVSYWDQGSQVFVTAVDLGFMWDGDFEIDSNDVLMLYSYSPVDFYSIGGMVPPAVYSLVAGNNTVMVPLNRSDLTWASEVGMDMALGTVDQVSYFDQGTQVFTTAVDLGFMWDGDFEVGIAMPLMAYSYDAFDWPTRGAQSHISNSKIR